MYFNNLGLALINRYDRCGQPEDLEEALRAYERAVEQSSANTPERSMYLSNLGSALQTLYVLRGRLQILERAICVCKEAVDHTPADAPYRPVRLNSLGNVLHASYFQRGRLEDLEAAIYAYEAAVQHTLDDSPERSTYLSNLGSALSDRYTRNRQLEDLEKSIQVCRQAIHLTPPDSPDHPSNLNHLGSGLRERYVRSGRAEDLDEAVLIYRQTVQLAPPDSPDYPSYLNNLGIGLWDRYVRSGEIEDLEGAIRCYRQSIQRTPSDSPALPSRLNNLGSGLRARYSWRKTPADLAEAIQLYRDACQVGLERYPEAALVAARTWGNWALERRSWPEASEAYGRGLEAVDRLFRVQLLRGSKEAWLREARGIPARAAYVLARLDRGREAIIALERGRARLLSEALARDRADLEVLEKNHPDLVENYRRSTSQLAVLEGGELRPETLPKGLDLTGEIRRARATLDEAIVCIRQVPGYETFLVAPELAEIAAAIRPACPLVYLALTPAGGLTLVFHTGGIETVWLDNLSEDTLRERVLGSTDDPTLGGYLGAYFRWRQSHSDEAATRDWLAALDETTHWLWDALVGPLVTALGRIPGENGGHKQAVLIPQGLLGLLPLHAAWTDDPAAPTGRRYALDEIVFSYAPNARAVARARETAAQSAPATMLAVDEPQPVTAGPLPSSAWEVAAAADYFPPASRQVLKGPAATAGRLCELLPGYAVLHLSCHGFADLSEPLQSGLVMAKDEVLTLRDILALQLPGARLAVLSACETGIPGAELPDEVVSLPAGLVQAGAAGVVGTLWSVADVSTAMLMVRFYDLWRKEGIEPTAALRQAQVWLRDSTNGEKAAYFQRDIPRPGGTRMPAAVAAEFYSQATMRDPEARDFAHPFYWAAFYLTGV